MAFTDLQLRQLRSPLKRSHVREREIDGRVLHYLEGWHVIAEANRIFGHDGWDRETLSTQCVWQKMVDRRFCAAYLARVRISVRTSGAMVVREGIGSGEAVAPSSGQAHERASKAAETDATKRALCTFGNPFGLSLYGGKRAGRGKSGKDTKRGTPALRRSTLTDLPTDPPRPVAPPPSSPEPAATSATSPHLMSDPNGGTVPPSLETAAAGAKVPLPAFAPPPIGSIDKSTLTLAEPKRQRNPEHLRFVARQPCLICGRTPSQAHHLRIAQPRALGRKVSDEFTVPLSSGHHHELHTRGNEAAWWSERNIEPMKIAENLWRNTGGDIEGESERPQYSANSVGLSD